MTWLEPFLDATPAVVRQTAELYFALNPHKRSRNRIATNMASPILQATKNAP
jgi:hypothetical protein